MRRSRIPRLQTVHQLIAEHPAHEESIRAFHKHWPEMVPHAYVECVSIMECLIAKGYDVTYREYEGGHGTPPGIARQAFAWLAGEPPK